jgi:hypothetical protein
MNIASCCGADAAGASRERCDPCSCACLARESVSTDALKVAQSTTQACRFRCSYSTVYVRCWLASVDWLSTNSAVTIASVMNCAYR